MDGVKGRKVVSPGGRQGLARGGSYRVGHDATQWQQSPGSRCGQVAKVDRCRCQVRRTRIQLHPLNSYGKGNMPAQPAEPETVAAPTGKETVKFSTDIAPLLVESCNGCHINGRRPSGGLNMKQLCRHASRR